jgi:hypothetical protein
MDSRFKTSASKNRRNLDKINPLNEICLIKFNFKKLKENCNVLVVAWGNGSAFPLYNNASSNIRLVGKQTGLVINDIRSVFYAANPTSFNVHCIGHSLGAHTCGYASRASIIPFARISGFS